ncbi:MAG: rRNA maturation RNase YbeY [Chloroflexi bacterium]|nr:rRNA maturation RNase YbeY [Chloroflexota bacterium]
MTAPEFDINLHNLVDDALPLERLREAAIWVLQAHDVPLDTGLSIVLTDDEHVRELNQQFRGIDAPTDVLSFPAETEETSAEPYLGDLILALPYIRSHADHPLVDELVLAVIHGTLHLLGYDHDTAEHEAQMWQAQAQALAALGVRIVVPRFSVATPDESPDSPTTNRD